jgi:hypothetical protein
MDERLGGVHEGQDSLLRKHFLQPSLVLLISLRTIGIQNLTVMSSLSWGSPLDSAEGRVFFAFVSDGCRFLGRTSTVRRGQSAVQDSPGGREPLPTKATGALPRAAGESKAGKRSDQSGAGAIGAVLRLERSAHHCAARDAYPLAQEGIPALLAVALESRRSAAPPSGSPAADCRDGPEQSDLGRKSGFRRSFC